MKSASGSKSYKDVEAYLNSFSGIQLERLCEIRDIVRQAAPASKEVISYNMPAMRQNAVLVYYAAYARHIGFYPTSSPIRVFKEELKKYKTSKGAIQFPLDSPIPKTLVKKIVSFRVKEDLVAAKLKARKAR